MTFDELYQKYHKKLRSFANRTIFDKNLLEDILQDTWVTIYKKYDNNKFSEKRNPMALLKTILQRRMVDQFRKSDNPVKSFARCNKEECIQYTMCEDTPIKKHDEICDKTMTALNSLDPGIRQCVIGVIMHGYTHKEMADKLGISIGTVLSRVHRGKSQLRNIY